jgi:WD40 repeat protein/serine/threonine protein kinase/tetratricopeptide (TPR) repeat protein
MPAPSADRNLLFGILALQMDFVRKDALIAAMHAWVLAKHRPLGDILAEHGTLSPDHRQLLEALVQAHLSQHGNDAQKSLAALSSLGSARKELEQVSDADVQASLGLVAAARPKDDGPYATVGGPPSGEPTVRYRVVRPHAKGGLGEVFVAEDTELGRQVALKEIQLKYADDPTNRTRFLVEAEITGGLEHPGVVPVYGLGTYADGRPFYAMRFVKGDNLQQAIKGFHGEMASGVASAPRAVGKDGPVGGPPQHRSPKYDSLEFRKLLRRFIDVCNAVAYAHGRGVLHRDLKPGNVMLGKYGETLVVDWGLAKSFAETVDAGMSEAPVKPRSAGQSTVTQMGNVLGTPAYMSPEQAAGRLDQLGPATDIYSLGATLYALLTGQAPYPAGDLDSVQKSDFPRPRTVKPRVPPALEAVCLKAMARRPADRYRTALALAEDVDHWLADELVTAWREPLLVRVRRWGRQHRPLVAGAAALLLTSAIGLVVGLILVSKEQAATAKERDQKELARRDAVAARDAEAAAFQRSRHGIYITQLGHVRAVYQTDPGLALGLLEDAERCPPDLREFTWRFYHRLCRRDRDAWAAHFRPVTFLAFLSDGRQLVTAGLDGRVKVWDPAGRRPSREWPAHRDDLLAAALSVDGKLLATGDRKGTIKVWDIQTGTERVALQALGQPVQAIALAGDRVAASGVDTLVVWALDRGEPLSRWTATPGAFWTLAFRPDGRQLAAGGLADGQLARGALRLYGGDDFREHIQSPDFRFGGLGALAFADAKSIVGMTNFGGAVAIDLSTYRLTEHNFTGETGIAVATARTSTFATASEFGSRVVPSISPRLAQTDPRVNDAGRLGQGSVTFKQAASHAHFRAVRLWDRRTLRPVSYLVGVEGHVTSLALSPNGQHAAVGTTDGRVAIWDIGTRPERGSMSARSAIAGLRFAPDGKSLVGVADGPAVFDLATGAQVLPNDAGRASPLEFSATGGQWVARVRANDETSLLALFESVTGHQLVIFQDSGGASGPALSPDGTMLAAVLVDGKDAKDVALWQVSSGRRVRTLEGSGGIRNLRFSPDGKLLAGSPDGGHESSRLWEIKTGRVHAELGGQDASPPVFAPDGSALAAFVKQQGAYHVRVWSASGGQIVSIPLEGRSPRSLFFAPDGGSLVILLDAGDKSVELRQCELPAGKLVGSATATWDHVTAPVQSDDRSLLAVGGGTLDQGARGPFGEVVLWDVVARRERARLHGHRGAIWSMAFALDGRTLATGSYDYTAKLWDTATGQELTTLEGHGSTVLSVAFSPDGLTLATGSFDQTVKLWAAPPPTVTLPPWTLRARTAAPFGETPDATEQWGQQFALLMGTYEHLGRRKVAALENPNNLAYTRDLAAGYRILADFQHGIGQRGTTMASLEQALPHMRKLVDAQPSEEAHRLALANCFNDLCNLQRMAKLPEAALGNGLAGLTLREELLRAKPDDPMRHSLAGATHNNVAMALHVLNRDREALDHLRHAVEHQQAAVKADPSQSRYRQFLRNHYMVMSSVHRALQQPLEAVEAATRAKELFPADPRDLYSVAQELAQCVPLVQGNESETRRIVTLAIETLDAAVRGDPKLKANLNRDQALQSIREDARFKSLTGR